MRTRTSCLAMLLLAAGMALAPTAARGQTDSSAPPDPIWPVPLYHDHPEQGGFYTFGEFLYFREPTLLQHQLIARRGLVDIDGSIVADLNGTFFTPELTVPFILPGRPRPGTFIGSGTPALFADDAGGPGQYQPGFSIGVGWRFANGVAVETKWWHLMEARYSATASFIPPNFNPGPLLADTFLFAPVFNFPNDFVGAINKLGIGNPAAAFGIWNGAAVMTVQLIQRFDQYDVTGRVPITENDCNRIYGLLGARLVWFDDNFRWRTVSEDFSGIANQDDVAIYTNNVSNRLYGFHIGCGDEYRLGDCPIGTFSIKGEVELAPMIDFVKDEAKYERGDFASGAKRTVRQVTIAGEVQASVHVLWYPIEGVEMRLGYDFMGFFNTVASPNPVSFNYGALDPPWERGIYRGLYGLDAGIGFIF